MTKQIEFDLNPKINSQSFLEDIINTVPLVPIWFEADFFAEDIHIPDEKDKRPQYIEKCLEKKIIPFSNIKLEYDSTYGNFIPKEKFGGTFFSMLEKEPELNQKILEETLNGGKINIIRISKIWGHDEAFGFFKTQIYDSLLKNNYALNNLNFTFSYDHFTGYDEGDSPDWNLTAGKKGLYVRQGYKLDKQETLKLLHWYNNMRDTYKGKAIKAEIVQLDDLTKTEFTGPDFNVNGYCDAKYRKLQSYIKLRGYEIPITIEALRTNGKWQQHPSVFLNNNNLVVFLRQGYTSHKVNSFSTDREFYEQAQELGLTKGHRVDVQSFVKEEK